MNRPLLVRTVFSRLWRFKAKTIFMGLGITIGVLATVLLQSVAISIQERFVAFIQRAYPANAVVLLSGGGPMSGPVNRDRLRLADIETVVSALSIREWDPMVVAGRRDVKHGANSTRISILGHSEKAESVRQQSVSDGEFFSADDIAGRANVALLGATTAKSLFPGQSPVGAQLFIDNVPFQVKGVLTGQGLDVHGGDQDDIIEIPYTTLMEKMLRTNTIPAVTLMVEDPSRVESARAEIERILRERHQIGEGQQDDFTVMTTALVMQMFNRSLGTMRIFVPLIAATAFLISALVILSIMQLSIKARKSEIGLRKAVGARERDLRLQFFLEVLIVSLIASVVGLILARVGISALTPMLQTKMGIHEVSAPSTLLLVAVCAAIATGVLGALLPARRAARLNPVEALR